MFDVTRFVLSVSVLQPLVLPAVPPRLWCFALVGVLLAVAGCRGGQDSDGAFPSKPIKIVVPFGPGGGSDTFARIIQHELNEQGILDQPVVIVNVPGAGATIGSRRVKDAKADGYTILHLHDAILSAKLSGVVRYGPESFEPIAGTGKVDLVIAVHESSPYDSLPALLLAAKEKPDSVLFAANIGAPSHFAGLMLEQQYRGAQFRYTQTGGGSDRRNSLAGGHVHVSAFSTSEYVTFRDSLKALAVCGEKRHPELPGIPTAIEQGVDVLSSNIGFWWAPRGTPQGRIEVLNRAFKQAIESPRVIRQLEKQAIEPVYLRADQMQASLADKYERMSSVAPKLKIVLPNFPLYVALATLAMAVAAIWQAVSSKASSVSGKSPETSAVKSERPGNAELRGDAKRPAWVRLICISVLTCVYVAVLHLHLVGFRPGTIGFVIAYGGILAGKSNKLRSLVVAMALFMGLGVHFALTEFFFIDLP